ncbi:MAG: hypothetical protein H6905_10895 [Hyphomicrobiales bacterium]|nr:hypothetical protein [Hyphomicrobiales bacterium]
MVPRIGRQTRDYFNLHRTVVCHRWETLGEWVRCLDDLSQLSDAEIDDLACVDPNDDAPAVA